MYHRRVFVFRRSRRRRDSAAHVVALLSSTRAPPLCVMTRTAFTSPVRRSVRKYRRAFYARRTVRSRDGESTLLIRRGPPRLVVSRPTRRVASRRVASRRVASRHVSSPSSASGGGGAEDERRVRSSEPKTVGHHGAHPLSLRLHQRRVIRPSRHRLRIWRREMKRGRHVARAHRHRRERRLHRAGGAQEMPRGALRRTDGDGAGPEGVAEHFEKRGGLRGVPCARVPVACALTYPTRAGSNPASANAARIADAAPAPSVGVASREARRRTCPYPRISATTGAPLARADASDSSTNTPAPSPITNPPRAASKGRQHSAGSSGSMPMAAGSARALALANPATEVASTHPSVPPASITSASPRWTSRNARRRWRARPAHAVAAAWLGPRRPCAMLTGLRPCWRGFGARRKGISGEARRARGDGRRW